MAQPKLPGRLGTPDMTIGEDPRADPRMVAALTAFGLDTHAAPAPVTRDHPMEDVHEYVSAAEEGFGGLFTALMNANASASGSDSFDGNGKTENASSFNAQLAVSVINVLPNGHLLVAGERSMALHGGSNTLRFSGIVDPRDIKPGNIVASADVVNARLELAGKGDVSEAASRNWMQRVLARTLSVW